jgi:CubicO group peptidase (beta-lactamase class C family)/pimeloyl-ACP methyl ester carboxylesterase
MNMRLRRLPGRRNFHGGFLYVIRLRATARRVDGGAMAEVTTLRHARSGGPVRRYLPFLAAVLACSAKLTAAQELAVTNVAVVDAENGHVPWELDTVAAVQAGMRGDTVHVAPPMGIRDSDRASILTALERVGPGATIQFAPGRYLVGESIHVPTPRITLLGHPEGTTLRGCDPLEYDRVNDQTFAATDEAAMQAAVSQCGMLQLTGGHVTVRGFTFEYSRLGLVLGSEAVPMSATPGGYIIEENTFRNSANGVRPALLSSTTVIRSNTFINVYHAISGGGGHLHVIDNDISVPASDSVPGMGHPSFAIAVAAVPPQSVSDTPGVACEGNIIARNRIEGHTDGILLFALAGGTCRRNEIRDNTIIAARVPLPDVRRHARYIRITDPADSTLVGIPISLHASSGGSLVENVIEGNRVAGAHGLAIELTGASRNRVVNNTITVVSAREPFPGNTLTSEPDAWRDHNGSGIWVSPGSNGNEIVGNTFEDIAGSAVVIEGDSNQVELQSADDAVRDLGTGNRVTRAAGVPSESDAPVGEAPQAATAQEWTDASPHEIRSVTVAPDVRLEVLDWGGDGLPLVFLAGANFNAHSFDDFAPRFTDTHRVLGITRRGHGNSSWPDAGYELPTLVEDIRVVLDSLGIDRAILAGHSMAGAEMTLLATESPDRVAGLIYIDAGHDPTDIDRLRVPELCEASFSPGFLEAMERTFENPELVRRTQWYTDEDGARRPFASAAGASIDLPTPDYSDVRAPALGIYYVPERTEDLFMGLGDPSGACVAAFHRYIHGGIAAFVDGVEQATVVGLSDTNHNIHLASPAALEAVMRQWLDSHAAPDPTDRLVREHMEALDIPAVSLVVMRNGAVLREAAYGRASLDLDVPATPATVFPYASMAKVFTGTAVLRLVQDGRLSLDGRIADLLPDLPPAWSDVTVRQLLAHTSGLPDLNSERGFQNPFVSPWASRAAALEVLAGQPVERAPGTGFSYNQTNYLLLGMLLERVDGRTVEEYVAEEIAGPLGLASLAYGDSRVPIAGRASWYSRLDFSEGEPRVVAPRPLWIEYPHFLHTAAGLNGTARDLAGFVHALASGRLLDDAHRLEMWTAVPLADGSTFRFEDGVTGAGLGWWVHDDPSHPWVGMGGAASGVVRHYLDEGLTIAVLTNLQGAEPDALASAIAEIYLRIDTVHVAPPTGEKDTDRASILAALEQVQPGGTVQFAPGTYTVGEFVRVTIPRITLLGHPDGTTLRGCDPVEFSDVAVAMAGLDLQETLQTVAGLVVRCNGLALTGERQTVRGLTFEHTWHALTVGCCPDPGELAESSLAGGHLIEGNTFRASINGFRVTGDLPEPVVIRDNDFINVWHAGVVNGRTAHILDNRVSAPDPRQVPVNGYPGLAFAISPQHPTEPDQAFACTDNVIAGNQIEGHPEGIAVFVFGGRAGCSDNAVRDNTIRVSRVRFTGPSWGVIGITNEADSTLAGAPITLADLSTEMADFFGLPAGPPGEALIHDNLVQGNRIVGGEGLGIEILRASRNRIVGNAITAITVRDPFPGNTMYVPPSWGEGNGSGIWVSPGSDGNEIVGNTFEDVASFAVVVEGDSNHVAISSASDSVRDLGRSNRIGGPAGAAAPLRRRPP